MSTFRTVLGFELRRTLQKRAFWLGALAVPVLVVVIGLVQYLSAVAAQDASDGLGDSPLRFSYLDDSSLIDPQLAAQFGGTEVDSAAAAIAAVQAGESDAFFHYPADLADDPVEVAGRHLGIIEDGQYGAVASALLSASARGAIGSDELVSLAQGDFGIEVTTYLEDGSVSSALQALPIGALLLVLLFLIVVLLSNTVLVATTEEKENRVAEILLTNARPDGVIAAKLVALSIVGLVQMAVVALPLLIGWALFRDQLDFGAVDFSSLVLEPRMLVLGIPILLAASALFIASLAAIGSMVPSAKEAGGFSFVAIFVPLAPLYAAALIVSQPTAPLVQVLTYFPFTAGTTALLRNALGSLELWEGLLVLLSLVVSAAVMLWIAVRAFRRGALEYTRMLGWRDLFGKAR